MKKIYLTLIALACLFAGRSFSQCTTASVVPYYEGFNISANNQLPACWAVSSATNCLTFTTAPNVGSAAFYYAFNGSDYFYSNAIQLNAGITYSASAWYKVLSNTNITWTDFSIMLGTTQGPAGLVSIASTNGNAVSVTNAPVSNTFVVATSGVYYIAVRGISNGNNTGSQQLIWDDLSITIPCTPAYNSPSLTLTASSYSLCSGQTFSATISGADTYSWNTGSTASTFTNTPNQSIQYSVVGTNTLSGCTTTLTSALVTVKSTPNVVILPGSSSICLGQSMYLTASGASTYSWSTGEATSIISVTPGITNSYSVVGTLTTGCSSSSVYSAAVNPLPVVTYSASAATHTVCKGESIVFTAASQSNVVYNWNTTGGPLFSGNTFSLTAANTTTVNIKAVDQNSCTNTATYALVVNNCTGIIEVNSFPELKIYPNPGQGNYNIETGNTELKTLVVIDLVGKIIFKSETYSEQIKLDIKEFPAGVYYAKIISAGGIKTVKFLKE